MAELATEIGRKRWTLSTGEGGEVETGADVAVCEYLSTCIYNIHHPSEKTNMDNLKRGKQQFSKPSFAWVHVKSSEYM